MQYIQRTRRVSTGARVLCCIFLGLFLVTVHAPHFSVPQSHVAIGMEAVDYGLPHSHGSEQTEAMDCPFPDLITPQTTILSDFPVLAGWFTTIVPSVLLELDVAYARVSPAQCPRPPGPTRQAVLQRFTL